MSFLFLFLSAVLFCASAGNALQPSGSTAVRILYDTDIAVDIDDTLSLLLLLSSVANPSNPHNVSYDLASIHVVGRHPYSAGRVLAKYLHSYNNSITPRKNLSSIPIYIGASSPRTFWNSFFSLGFEEEHVITRADYKRRRVAVFDSKLRPQTEFHSTPTVSTASSTTSTSIGDEHTSACTPDESDGSKTLPTPKTPNSPETSENSADAASDTSDASKASKTCSDTLETSETSQKSSETVAIAENEFDYDYVVAVGPLTNIAAMLESGQIRHIQTLILMGGSLMYSKNEDIGLTEALSKDYNFRIDPDAAELVLQKYYKSEERIGSVYMVTGNITLSCWMTSGDYAYAWLPHIARVYERMNYLMHYYLQIDEKDGRTTKNLDTWIRMIEIVSIKLEDWNRLQALLFSRARGILRTAMAWIWKLAEPLVGSKKLFETFEWALQYLEKNMYGSDTIANEKSSKDSQNSEEEDAKHGPWHSWSETVSKENGGIDENFVYLHDPLALSAMFALEEGENATFVEFEEMQLELYKSSKGVLQTIVASAGSESETAISVNVSTGCNCDEFRMFMMERIFSVIEGNTTFPEEERIRKAEEKRLLDIKRAKIIAEKKRKREEEARLKAEAELKDLL